MSALVYTDDKLTNIIKEIYTDDEFNRNKLLKLLQKHYIRVKSSIDNTNFMKILLKDMDEIENMVLNVIDAIDIQMAQVHIDVLRKYIEGGMVLHSGDMKEKPWNYYPEYTDSTFNKDIYLKKEFNEHKMPLWDSIDQLLEKRKKRRSLSESQKFVKNFVSESTPYNGILLWHGVGVGKTCAGISIAENFRDTLYVNNRKILVLTPSDTLLQNWKDEIFNIEKELLALKNNEIGSVQCTGNKYSKQITLLQSGDMRRIKSQTSKYINTYYEFMGYQKLAGIMKRDMERFEKDRFEVTINYIKNKFSNRVIIMDEVHVTRDSGMGKDKIVQPYIELIARYAENTKIILLTATPMYNISKEIVWLMNILLWNDKRAPIESSDIFYKDGIRLITNKLDEDEDDEDDEGDEGDDDKEDPIQLLIQKTRGYISYVRGGNPFTFPIKLDPVSDNMYTPSPGKTFEGGWVDLDKKDMIVDMPFYKNTMSVWQYEHVFEYIQSKEEPDKRDAFSTKVIQASNIVFPNKEVGDDGFKGCIKEKRGKYQIRDSYKDFLNVDNISKYSCKFANILRSLQTNKGIGYVFSKYVASGIKTMALLLEANGFARYIGDDTTDNFLEKKDQGKPFCATHLSHDCELKGHDCKQARYIYFDGTVAKANLNKLVKECRGEREGIPNLHGDHIKVILGSPVIEQGISFLNVREIHILDPWHHFNQSEQAIGRAMRNYSHFKLNPDEQNVTVYMHIAALPSDLEDEELKLQETPDERIYRRAYYKKTQMSRVTRLLMQNAIDCELNKYNNMYLEKYYTKSKPLSQVQITDSKGNKYTKDLYDADDDEYYCFLDGDSEADISEEEVNEDTYNILFAEYDIQLAEEYIGHMFSTQFVYRENQIIEHVQLIEPKLNEEHIRIALYNLVENRTKVVDEYKRLGYIIQRNHFYIFQPSELDDEHMPIMYRYLSTYSKPKSIPLNTQLTLRTPEKKIEKKIKSPKTPKLDKNMRILYNTYGLVTKYIREMYNEFSDESEPSQSQLIKCLFISEFEKYDSNERCNIIKYIIETYYYDIEDDSIEIPDYVKVIFEYYDRKYITKFILRYKDIDEDDPTNNKISGFRFIISEPIIHKGVFTPKITEVRYLFNKDRKLIKLASLSSKLSLLQTKIDDNNNLLYGYIGDDKRGLKIFYCANGYAGKVEQHKKDGSKSKKTNKTGAACVNGSVLGAKNKAQLMDLINTRLLDNQIYPLMELVCKNSGKKCEFIYSKSDKLLYESPNCPMCSTKLTKKEIKIPMKPSPIADVYTQKSLCQVFELLLRYKDMATESATERYFYTFEERLLQIENDKKD